MAYAIWNWRFFGFQWLNGNEPVQIWFDGLPRDARGEALDTFGYLQHSPITAWRKPRFDPLKGEEISEIRFYTDAHTYRVYGYFGPSYLGRQVFTFLYGHDKKTSNDVDGKREATKRKRDIERQKATVHKFEFVRLSNREDQAWPEGSG